MQAQAVFDTKPLLRPAQIEDTKSEIKALEAKLQSPHIEDKGEVAKQLRRVTASFETQRPKPPESGEEEGRMVARSRDLLNDILQGMPSQEEMRKAPPGAVDKHMKWEKTNKQKIAEWKNLQLRLTHGTEPDAANLERHRPVGSSLNMDNAYIPGKTFFMPPEGAGIPVMFSNEQLAFLRTISPDLADQVGLMSNDQRRQVKQVLDGGIGLSAEVPAATPSAASIAGHKGAAKKAAMKAKRTLSPEHKAAMKAGRDAKKAAKQ